MFHIRVVEIIILVAKILNVLANDTFTPNFVIDWVQYVIESQEILMHITKISCILPQPTVFGEIQKISRLFMIYGIHF